MEGGNIIRNVFGKSYKEAEHIMKDASKGALDFKSPQENTFYGKKGGKKLDEYEAKQESQPLKVKAVKCYEDFECSKEVKIIEKDKKYFFKAVQYSRSPTKAELKSLKWSIQYDNNILSDAPQVTGEEKISYSLPKDRNIERLKVYAFFKAADPNIKAEVEVVFPHIRIVITDEITGYTIQALKGEDYTFSDPAVVVPTYKVNVLNYDITNKNGKTEFSFNATRDGWYNLGKNKDGKYELLNRAFVPANWNQNLYGAYWIPSYPNFAKAFRSGLDAFIFTRFGKRKIPAQPLRTQKMLNGKDIESSRTDENLATDVMIHVGGTYEVDGYDHLGGSLGCFAFIPDDDVYSTPELAKTASENDDYDDKTSNEDWKKIADKIIKLSFERKKELRILLNYRDESKNYYPNVVFSE